MRSKQAQYDAISKQVKEYLTALLSASSANEVEDHLRAQIKVAKETPETSLPRLKFLRECLDNLDLVVWFLTPQEKRSNLILPKSYTDKQE